ncbi:MAG: DNA pilot protein [Microvirus sp.]|nr:MAG: DNA pilot protein [Microvirus sp.]
MSFLGDVWHSTQNWTQRALFKPAKQIAAGLGHKYLGLPGNKSHQNPLLKMVQNAKEAGIHPLYAMGAAQSISPQWDVGGGPDLGGIADAFRSFTPEANAKATVAGITPMEQAQIDLLRQQTRTSASQENLNNSNAMRLFGPGQPGTGITQDASGVYNAVPPNVPLARPGSPNVQAGPQRPLMIPLPNGGATPDPAIAPSMLSGDWYWLKDRYQTQAVPTLEKWGGDIYNAVQSVKSFFQ